MKNLAALCVLFCLVGCGKGTSNAPEPQDGIYELYLDDALLSVLVVTFVKGRCLGRLDIDDKSEEARSAILAMAQNVADSIPLDGTRPDNDAALTALVPSPPLSGELEPWAEDLADNVNGPWLVSTTAFDWINGSGGPFQDNGFEAVAGESYEHSPLGFGLSLELVNMTTTKGAEAAFGEAQWDTGQKQ